MRDDYDEKDLTIKKEASIPVQTRIDIRTLARLERFWKERGEHIRTMSQLVAWSIDMVEQILVENGKLPEELMTIAQAEQLLIGRGLVQRSMQKISRAKLHRAEGYENLRMEGEDPQIYDRSGNYERLHSRKDSYMKAPQISTMPLKKEKIEILINEEGNEYIVPKDREHLSADELRVIEEIVNRKMAKKKAAKDEEERKKAEEFIESLPIDEHGGVITVPVPHATVTPEDAARWRKERENREVGAVAERVAAKEIGKKAGKRIAQKVDDEIRMKTKEELDQLEKDFVEKERKKMEELSEGFKAAEEQHLITSLNNLTKPQ